MAEDQDAVMELTESLQQHFTLGSITDECLNAFGAKTVEENPSISHLLSAVSHVIVARGEAVTEQTLFYGLLVTLEKQETIAKPQICAGVCSCLSVLLVRLPKALLHLQATKLMTLYVSVMRKYSGDVGIAKTVLSSLSYVLITLNEGEMEVAESIVEAVVPLMAHSKSSKIVKAAVRVMETILKTEAFSRMRKRSCERIEHLCSDVTMAPLEILDSLSKETDQRKRSKKQDALDAAVLSLTNLLSALAVLLPLTAASFVRSTCSHLWTVFRMQLPELSAMASDVFKPLFLLNCPTKLEPRDVKEIVGNLHSHVGSVLGSNLQLAQAYSDTVHVGLHLILRREGDAVLKLFARLLPSLLQLLLSEYEEVRIRSKQNLSELMRSIAESRASSEQGRLNDEAETETHLAEVCECVEAALGISQGEDLVAFLPVVKLLFALIRREEVCLVHGILTKLGNDYQLFIGEDHVEQEGQEKPATMKVLEESLGMAITHLGARAVMEVLPLNIKEALEGTVEDEPRTWMLPLMKKYTKSDSLAFWMDVMLPIANASRKKAFTVRSADEEMEFKCKTLEKQYVPELLLFLLILYTALSSRSLSELLGQAFTERPYLQDVIALTISRVCHYPCYVLKSYAESEGQMDLEQTPHGCGKSSFEIDSSEIPAHYTTQLAEQAIGILRDHVEKWFEIIATTLTTSASKNVTSLVQAVSALAGVSSPSALKSMFHATKNRVYQSFQDAASSNPHEQGAYFDVLFALLPSIDVDEIGETIRMVELVIQSNVTPLVQKKGYKILEQILKSRPDAWMDRSQEMARMLEDTCGYCQPSSLQFRLRCVKDFLMAVAERQSPTLDYNELVVTFLPEIVIALIDANTKAKEKAQQALLQIGRHYSECGRFDMLALLVKEGLSSEDLSMIAGSIRAIQTLMERFGVLFADQLTQIMDAILRIATSQEEEMATSSMLSVLLEFVQTAIESTPTMALGRYVGAIVELLLEWEAPMKNAREQTKTVLLRLGELIGFEEIQKFVPEDYSRVMRNLRKLHRRSASQMGKTEKNSRTEGGTKSVKAVTKAGKSNLDSALWPAGSGRKSLLSRQSALSRPTSLADPDAMEDAVDLLDPTESRRIAKAAAGQTTDIVSSSSRIADDGFKLPVNSEGKLVIDEKSLHKAEKLRRKRTRQAAGLPEKDDSLSIHSGAKSKKSHATRDLKSLISKRTKQMSLKSHHSGKRFEAKKGAGGDSKGSSRLEPYAYWRLDRNLLNKRRGKRNVARKDLKKIGRHRRKSIVRLDKPQ